ncbi:MAG TPA: IPT/TIG domain-containing protein, partial [Elusimicrobiales bacterium]|nr:IPT/TIG domain-containing protein [Elusimicrobiales bacterium]
MTAEFGMARVEVPQITEAGKIILSRVGYDPRIPGYRLVSSNDVYDIKVTAQYEGELKISFRLPEDLGQPQAANAEIYHYDEGEWVKVTSARENGWVSCSVGHASPFALVVPYSDTEPPYTGLASSGDWYEEAGVVWLSSGTAVELRPVDFPLNQERSGVATTYYLVDIEPTPACLSAPRDPAAPSGTCANPYYRAPFFLAEGEHTVHYFSVDKLGNEEALKSRAIRSDGTAPLTELLWNLGNEAVYCDGLRCLGPLNHIGFNASDPVSGGVASGVDLSALLIDVSPESCGGFEETDPQAPLGTCLNPIHTGPFEMSGGPHTLYYFSADKTGNFENALSTPVFVDAVAPEVTLSADGAEVPDGGSAFLAAGTSITLSAFDPLSDGFAAGINEAEYLIDVTFDSCPPEEEGGDGEGEGDGEEGEDGEDEEDDGPRGTCGNSGYEGPFTLTPGTHTVYYLAHDMVMNGSAVRTAYFTVTPSSGTAEASITPSSGPIGLPFNITGSGFGTYSAGTTLALIGGATAPLTLWTDAQIKGTVPGSLAAGEYPVLVMRGSEVLAETSS